MSAYPAGYIEQLARPFRVRAVGQDERARRGRRGESPTRDSPAGERDGSRLSSSADAPGARR